MPAALLEINPHVSTPVGVGEASFCFEGASLAPALVLLCRVAACAGGAPAREPSPHYGSRWLAVLEKDSRRPDLSSPRERDFVAHGHGHG
eukprot:scaffold161439_cov25-Tisochrysis_lutea.AAC.4